MRRPPQAESLAPALAQWQLAAGPYWMYVCAAPFLRSVPLRGSRSTAAASESPLLATIDSLPTDEALALYVDLSPIKTLPLTADLNNRGFRVVPVIQRWMAAPAVIPCGELSRQLLSFGAKSRPIQSPRGTIFLIDGERAGPPNPGTTSAVKAADLFDNRYEYPLCRFPPPQLLLREGVTRTIWLNDDGVALDLQPYARRLADAGLPPDLVASRA